jgi:NAD(P) transhydrogenase
VELFVGQAAFVDSHAVRISPPDGAATILTADVFLIATGSQPYRPPEIPFDDHVIFDSDSILGMDRIPSTMVVIGGGVIGCEYASIFAALGVEVVLVDGRDRLLPFLDAEISERLRSRLADIGVKFVFKDRLAKIEKNTNGVHIDLQSGKKIDSEAVLYAAGRRAAVEGLDLAKAGLGINARGYIEVGESYQTASGHIYAAGDVIGFPALASTSMEQGRVAVCHAFGFEYKKRLAHMLPMGIYTIPEVSSVGETEQSCAEKGIAYEVGRAHYSHNSRGEMIGETSGLLKLVFRRDDRRLLGVHIVGASATELIHIGMIVLEVNGMIDLFIESVFNYPTLSEMYKYAAYDGLGNLAGHKLREG